ncbi:putative acetyltransferase [Candidatus Arthromitus sp. SFB-rat-Yit]|nr:GNAT family protein [Candidatus Arthromitus sp. SFB-rat-Yit]BAK80686.1 putative acetyltransferase [Candidatus Arthromitus sp. SFB-rat-Yit]
MIKLKKDLSPIGFISIIPRYIHENLINELGYFIIKYYRNNNFMKEAIFHTLNYVFNNTNIDKIYSLVEDSNSVSKHILLNIMMFNFIGSLPNCSKLTQVYYLTKSKFLNQKELIYIKTNKCLIKNKRTLI